MGHPPQLTPATLAAQARRAATAALADSELLLALMGLGYTHPAFRSALADAQALEAALTSTSDPTAHDARATFHRTVYAPHLNAARALVACSMTRSRLELDRARYLAFDAWTAQARRFYLGVLNDTALTDRLNRSGVPTRALCDALAHLDSLAPSTPDVQALAERVGLWLAGLHEAAPEAVNHRPDWAERLGLISAWA